MEMENYISFVTMISQSFSSTPACQWGAPPWEGSGWMVLVCGAVLEVWRARVAVEAPRAAWACGTRLWRTSPACVATATTTWAWRTVAAVLHSGTWDQTKYRKMLIHAPKEIQKLYFHPLPPFFYTHCGRWRCNINLYVYVFQLINIYLICIEPYVPSAVISTWCVVSGLMRRRSCWSCCRAWSLRTASPPGVNRCCTLSTPLPTTPPPLWMVGCSAFTYLAMSLLRSDSPSA